MARTAGRIAKRGGTARPGSQVHRRTAALQEIAVDGCITKTPGGQRAERSPVDHSKQGTKRRSLMVSS
jgi:hypothetical protein